MDALATINKTAGFVFCVFFCFLFFPVPFFFTKKSRPYLSARQNDRRRKRIKIKIAEEDSGQEGVKADEEE